MIQLGNQSVLHWISKITKRSVGPAAKLHFHEFLSADYPLVVILLDNALKHTPVSGLVQVELKAEADHIYLMIRDIGIGIAPEDLPYVFDRFYRADKARRRDPGGSGLGLSIARWIVERHQGSIQIASQPGQGTTVSVVLPVR